MPGPSTAAPSSLARTLAHLNREPRHVLPPSVFRSLSLVYANRNAHYGARHFVKENLSRIAYANPALIINVTRKEHKREEPWKPEIIVELADGSKKTIDMTMKHSSAILQELLAIKGADAEVPALEEANAAV